MLALPLLLVTRIIVWHAYTGAEEAALKSAIQVYNRQKPAVAAEAIESVRNVFEYR